ncbi:MAG TPA: DUF4114 domain-containing protein [Gemmatimonadaceae bacterium]|nr:DUF4114 domain-containing protein [Gemmatimonadaceae bacterium]
MKRAILKCAAIGAAVVFAAAPAKAQVSFYGTGGDVWVKYMGCDAAYTSDLRFGYTVGGSTTQLFNCHGSTVGDQVDIGPVSSGTEVIFSLFVQTTGQTYYTGPATRNPDGLVHAASSPVTGDGVYTEQFGFEDTYGGGDMDFNDTNFRVGGVTTSVTPEPSSLILAASGLGFLGLGGLRRRRNRA